MKVTDLPLELIEQIFYNSSSENLAYSCKLIHSISLKSRIRAKWLLLKFRENVYRDCWTIKFMSNKQCKCKLNASFPECPLQKYQCEILRLVLKNDTFNIGIIEHGIIIAAIKNHLYIVNMLIVEYGAKCDFKVVTLRRFHQWIRHGNNHKKRISNTPLLDLQTDNPRSVSLLQQAAEWNYIELVRVLLMHDLQHEQLTSKESIQNALRIAFNYHRTEIARILIECGHAITSPIFLSKILNRAGLSRVISGNIRKYEDLITVAIQGLENQVLDQRAGPILKSLGETGCIKGLQICIQRNVDVNINNGVILYSAIYNGNVEILEFLLQTTEINLAHFNNTHWVFTIILIFIECLATSMFIILLVTWIISIVQAFQNPSDSDMIWQLSGIAVPSICAIGFMYRIVPIHRLAKCLDMIYRERRRERSIV